MVSSRAALAFVVILVVVGAAAYSAGQLEATASVKATTSTLTSITTVIASTSVQSPSGLVQYFFSPGGNCDTLRPNLGTS